MKEAFNKFPTNAPAPSKDDGSSVRLIVFATLAFRRAGGPTPESTTELEQALAATGAVTLEIGYRGASRTVEVARDKVEELTVAVGDKYGVERARQLSINI